MSDAASFDAIMQCNLLEIFCEALGAAILVTDKLDEISFASVRLMHFFPIPENALTAGGRARDLYGAMFDAGCRFGSASANRNAKPREDWIAERVASAWKECTDTIEQSGPDRWFRIVSRRFSTGLGLTVIQEISEHKKKELQWRGEQERVRLTEEILDSLPIAIAIKDKNLTFAAVNQKFCTMHGQVAEAVLGKSNWDIFKPEFAATIEKAERDLLVGGEDRKCILTFNLPDHDAKRLLYRARRIGRPGHHYITLSFDEIEEGMDVIMQAVEPASLIRQDHLDVAPNAGFSVAITAPTEQSKQTTARVIYVDVSGSAGENLPSLAKGLDVELCVIRSEAELCAFLPALAATGIKVNLIAGEADAPLEFELIAARHGVGYKKLAAGDDVLESIMAGLNLHARRDGSRIAETEAIDGMRSRAGRPDRIDLLAIEDNDVNRLVLEQIFENLGLNGIVVSTGSEGIAKIAALNPPIVLADVTLPDMEIADLLPSLDALLAPGANRPPVIGLICRNSEEMRKTCRDAGFVDSLVKPLSPENVDIAIRKNLFRDGEVSKLSSREAA